MVLVQTRHQESLVLEDLKLENNKIRNDSSNYFLLMMVGLMAFCGAIVVCYNMKCKKKKPVTKKSNIRAPKQQR